MSTSTIHDDIDSWLAASAHDQLSPDERVTFEQHLAACPSCRSSHQEQRAMSKLIENTLAADRPDPGFEQRTVSQFRNRIPEGTGFTTLLRNLLRTRATQLTAVAAVLLALVQLGKLVTHEDAVPSQRSRALSEMSPLTPTKKDNRAITSFENEPTFRSAASSQSGGFNDAALNAKKRMGASGSMTSETESAPAPRTMQAPLPSAPTESNAYDAATDAVAEKDAPEPSIVTGSNVPMAEEVGPSTSTEPAPVDANRKLVRNAQVELEIVNFDDAVQKITAFAAEDRGYIATSSSEKQANGKLRGQVVVKVLPDRLDVFLLKLRSLGELKNQTLGTEDVTKQYFDTDSRLKSARVMEQRLIDILKTKSTKVADLLEVEKELGRVRAQIEEMQGTLKYMDAQVQFATVTITLAEKDMNLPTAFLLKRHARLALFSTDVEKTFAEVKGVVESAKAQLSSSTLDRDSSGEATATLVLLIVPEEADALIDRIKGMGRVQNYTEQTDRVAQGGIGMSENAKVERDKVELSITISRNEQEPAFQTTSLRILTSAVADKTARLKEDAAKAGAEIRSSSFSRDPDGQEVAFISLRVAMKNYAALFSSFDQLGKVKDVSVQREERRGVVNEETAPADISIQVYSQPNIVSDETGLFATIRRTLAQGASALMWSLRMIGVALAFLAPWALALVLVAWAIRRIARARAARHAKEDPAE